MDRERVLGALEVLNRELADADQVSDDAREALARVTEDIRQHVAVREAAGSDDEDAATALKDALLEFEADHPQLTGAINQLASALANLGI
jgi:hypothetical protein